MHACKAHASSRLGLVQRTVVVCQVACALQGLHPAPQVLLAGELRGRGTPVDVPNMPKMSNACTAVGRHAQESTCAFVHCARHAGPCGEVGAHAWCLVVMRWPHRSLCSTTGRPCRSGSCSTSSLPPKKACLTSAHVVLSGLCCWRHSSVLQRLCAACLAFPRLATRNLQGS